MTSAARRSDDFSWYVKYQKTSLGKVNTLVPIPATSTILALTSYKVLDFGMMWYLIRPHSLGM